MNIKNKILRVLPLLSLLIAPIVFAVNITVPSAPGSGYFLYSTSTGAYMYVSSSTADWGGTWLGHSISYFQTNLNGSYVSSVSTTLPLFQTNSTGTVILGINQASSTANGYLSSTDWNTFNNKVSSQWTTTSTGIYYNGGRVGIGTAAPDHALTVSGNIHTTQGLYVDNSVNPTSTFTGGITIGTFLNDAGTSTLQHLRLPNVTSSLLATDANGYVVATTTSGGGTNYWSLNAASSTVYPTSTVYQVAIGTSSASAALDVQGSSTVSIGNASTPGCIRMYSAPIIGVELYTTSLYTDPNLVAYYRMEGNSNDSKGSFNGTDTNMTYSTSSGKFGQGASFNGSNSQIALTTPIPSGSQNVSVTAWYYTTSTGTQTIWGDGNYPTQSGAFDLYLNSSGKVELDVKNAAGTTFTLAPTSTVTSTYTNVVAVFSTSSMAIYQNGVFAGSTTTTGTIGGQQTNIGSWPSVGNYFNGDLDDVAVFNRALTQTDINLITQYVSSPNYLYFNNNKVLTASTTKPTFCQ